MKKALLVTFLAVFFTTVLAADYPRKAVTIICPWGAGGGTDRIARFLADELSKKFGQPFTVVNKTGGGGAVGHSAGAYAAPDGYTLTLVTMEIASMHWMGLTTLTYEDFEYIAQFNEDSAGVMVKADAPWKTLNDLLQDIKANPGKYLFSGTAAGGIWDLARIGMLDAAGIPVDYVTWVPSTGAAQGLVELLGGHVHVVTCSLAEAITQIQSGQARALAVMADERDPRFPDVPTLKEMGINWSAGTWRGIAVPRKTPVEIKSTLEKAILEIVETDAFKNFMSTNGFGIKVRNAQEFYEFARQQDQAWKHVLELGGYTK
ncbi:tripartite tricarboxylate transporter substrate binding protein [Pseudothermotoga sp. U03pept]|uniref:tripartite tricarboxylate transporter substrate binding protein n=1 Tax=Pseudothermotoga sp. U03pept TaxID=3447012 RepID=UPI00309AFE67